MREENLLRRGADRQVRSQEVQHGALDQVGLVVQHRLHGLEHELRPVRQQVLDDPSGQLLDPDVEVVRRLPLLLRSPRDPGRSTGSASGRRHRSRGRT